jgi:hypothetical protein
MVLKLGLNGSLAPGGEDVGSLAVRFGQDFERTVIFSLDRFKMRFRRHAFQRANAARGAAGNAKPCWRRRLILALPGAPGTRNDAQLWRLRDQP